MPYVPTVRKTKSPVNNFAGQPNDANRVAMSYTNAFQTQDATTVPVTSPATVATTQILTVPQNAVSITLLGVTNAVQVSEDSSQTAFFSVPAGIPFTIGVANQQYVYLKVASSTVVSFYFSIV
jgi:hypothetical protein